MMSISQYLREAQAAVKFVQAHMTFGADNKLADKIRTGGANHWAIENMRADAESFMNDGNSWIAFKEEANKVDVRAWLAKHYGAGNCMEQSALAYVYLRDRKIAPLDWCRFDIRRKNHAFVILGAAAEIRLNNFAEWTRGAVLCDPWDGYAGEACYIIRRWSCKYVMSVAHYESETFGGFGGLESRGRFGP
jgi:hypothetical protein